MIIRLFKLTIALVLFRAGPEEMPFSLPVTRALAALAVATSTLLMLPFVPFPLAIAAGIGGVGGIAFFTQALLRIRKQEPRLLQTLAAQYAVGSLFAVLLYPAFVAMAPYVLEMMKNPNALSDLESGKMAAPSAGLVSFIADLLLLWNLVVSVRINRAAAELSSPLGWLLTLASLFVVMSFVTMAQVIVFPLVK